MESTEKGERSKIPAYDRILGAASELFYLKGIRAVGVEAVAEAAGVTKKTLYEKFGSKDNLVSEYLRARDLRWRDYLEGFVGERGGSAREKLLATFDGLQEWMARENPRGCGFVNAYAELADPDHPARAVVLEQKRWLLDYLVELLREARAEDPESMAERLLILHEGAAVAESMGTANGSVRKAREIAAVLVSGL